MMIDFTKDYFLYMFQGILSYAQEFSKRPELITKVYFTLAFDKVSQVIVNKLEALEIDLQLEAK